jgi:hypothetical protein
MKALAKISKEATMNNTRVANTKRGIKKTNMNITNNEDNQQEGEAAMRVITIEARATRSRPAEEATIKSKAMKKEMKFTTRNIHASENTNNMITTTNKAEETSTEKNRITSKTNNSTRTTSRWEPT